LLSIFNELLTINGHFIDSIHPLPTKPFFTKNNYEILRRALSIQAINFHQELLQPETQPEHGSFPLKPARHLPAIASAQARRAGEALLKQRAPQTQCSSSEAVIS